MTDPVKLTGGPPMTSSKQADRAEDLRDLADAIANALDQFLNAVGTDSEMKHRQALAYLLWNNKGTFAPALRRAAAPVAGTTDVREALEPENADERRMFDDLCVSMGWSPLQQIANSLIMERNLTSIPGASYWEQKTIAYNEIQKARASLSAPAVERSREEIARVVKKLLYDDNRVNDYPIDEIQDDRGLTEKEYVQFALDVLAALSPLPAREPVGWDAVIEALQVFAKAADSYDPVPGVSLTHGDVELWQQPNRAGYRLTVDDLRRARTALSWAAVLAPMPSPAALALTPVDRDAVAVAHDQLLENRILLWFMRDLTDDLREKLFVITGVWSCKAERPVQLLAQEIFFRKIIAAIRNRGGDDA